MTLLQPLLGIIVFVGIGFAFSRDRASISWRVVITGLVLQGLMAVIFLKLPFMTDVFLWLNKGVMAIDSATKSGARFMFGYLAGGQLPFEERQPGTAFIVAFQVLPLIMVVSALASVLTHWGIIQRIVSAMSWLLKKVMGSDGATATGVAASVFLGIIEAPLFIKPYLKKISPSGLFTIMTAAMATVAGTVMVLYASTLSGVIDNAAGQMITASLMSAPAAVMMAHLFMPQRKEDFVTAQDAPRETSNTFEALINGATDGINMVIHIAGIIVVLFSLVALLNLILAELPLKEQLTVEVFFGFMFAPFCWLMGIATDELLQAGQLMATKTILNEYVAYLRLSALPSDALSDQTRLILTYAMCGFANLGSLGILIGGLGIVIPERKHEVVALASKALVAGTLATMLTGCFVALLG